MSHSLPSLLERDWRPRILLVGDVMLDRYLWATLSGSVPRPPFPCCESANRSTGWAAPAASRR